MLKYKMIKNDNRKDRRYKMTSCREKRLVVRALNTFSKQYKFIKCNDTEVDLSLGPITFHYSDEIYNDIFSKDKNRFDDDNSEDKERQEERHKRSSAKSIVFKKTEALNDLQNTKHILDTIDNLISLIGKSDEK